VRIEAGIGASSLGALPFLSNNLRSQICPECRSPAYYSHSLAYMDVLSATSFINLLRRSLSPSISATHSCPTNAPTQWERNAQSKKSSAPTNMQKLHVEPPLEPRFLANLRHYRDEKSSRRNIPSSHSEFIHQHIDGIFRLKAQQFASPSYK
jgi:hypothetical protein